MNTAELDQLMAGLKDIATMTKAAYDEYIKAGFTPQQALHLTFEFQKNMMFGGK